MNEFATQKLTQDLLSIRAKVDSLSQALHSISLVAQHASLANGETQLEQARLALGQKKFVVIGLEDAKALQDLLLGEKPDQFETDEHRTLWEYRRDRIEDAITFTRMTQS